MVGQRSFAPVLQYGIFQKVRLIFISARKPAILVICTPVFVLCCNCVGRTLFRRAKACVIGLFRLTEELSTKLWVLRSRQSEWVGLAGRRRQGACPACCVAPQCPLAPSPDGGAPRWLNS
eukprot:6213483-Pleurochrysis_carterae.AAC.1